MDIEIAEAMDGLRGRIHLDLREAIDELRVTLRAELAETRADLRAELAETRAELRTELADTRAELRTELADTRADLRAELADTRRHAVVLTESVRDDIRIVAEGLAVLAAKVDALAHGGPAA